MYAIQGTLATCTLNTQNLLDEHVAEIRERLDDLQAEITSIGGTKGTEKKDGQKCMTNQKQFSNLPKYNGKHDDYEDWRSKVRTFVSEEKEFKELMILTDDQKEVPTEEKAKEILGTVNTNVNKINGGRDINKELGNHKLYQILCLNLEGKALNMIKNLRNLEETNGIVGWRKLVEEVHQ